MPHSAASDLCLYVLPLSQKMNAMFRLVNNFCYVLMSHPLPILIDNNVILTLYFLMPYLMIGTTQTRQISHYTFHFSLKTVRNFSKIVKITDETEKSETH